MPAPPSLIEHFAALRDPRQSWKVLYPLSEILLVILCATLAGAEDFVEIRRWGGVNEAFLRRLLPFAPGIASHDTLNDIRNALDGTLFAQCFSAWVESLRTTYPTAPTCLKSSQSMARPRGEPMIVPASVALSTSSRPGRAASAWCSASRPARPSPTRSPRSPCCSSAWL
jgi:DDE_Tnp_1-associated